MQELVRTCDKIKTDSASLDTQHQATIELIQKNISAFDLCNTHLAHLLQQQQQAVIQHPDYIHLQHEASAIELSLRDATLLIHEADQLRVQQKELDERLAVLSQLQEKIHAQDTRANTISQLCAWLKQARLKLQSYEQQLQPFVTLGSDEHELQQKLYKLNTAQQDIVGRKERALEKRGSLINAAHTIKNALAELSAQEKLMRDIDQDMHDYQAIAQATGKDGLQALLIEEAIPEIEQEANELLGRLTNNQAQLFIESLRDLKKGGTKETLDIKISDATGTRPYEMFSGGEAFRIDFALRIAISKLLARRAGTALRTLIIDEGFGSQDEEGLGYIMDAIYKIQDDFAKVIIVSHLASMKDQFPVHFVVEKGPSGSKVHIIEQG
jgi:exonuclease SbcC